MFIFVGTLYVFLSLAFLSSIS